MTRPTDPPLASNRFFTEKSPRWVWQPSLGGFFGILALMVLHLLPDDTHPYLAWGMALVPLVAMGVLVRGWRRRLPVSAWELEYLRVGIVLLTICGLGALSGGALPLSLVVGPAFFVWT
ncbi:MAG: hypothetical protein ABWX74_15105, partial [Aeromicrobium sp.]